jgi:hypothetical protein
MAWSRSAAGWRLTSRPTTLLRSERWAIAGLLLGLLAIAIGLMSTIVL